MTTMNKKIYIVPTMQAIQLDALLQLLMVSKVNATGLEDIQLVIPEDEEEREEDPWLNAL